MTYKITVLDHALFTIRKLFYRTVGRYLIRWDHYGLTIFGFGFISKRTLELEFSKESADRIREGMTDIQYQEFCINMNCFQTFPRPGLPNYVYTEAQKSDYCIWSFGNNFYIFRLK